MKVIARLDAHGIGTAISLQPSVRCASGGGIPLDGVVSRLTY